MSKAATSRILQMNNGRLHYIPDLSIISSTSAFSARGIVSLSSPTYCFSVNHILIYWYIHLFSSFVRFAAFYWKTHPLFIFCFFLLLYCLITSDWLKMSNLFYLKSKEEYVLAGNMLFTGFPTWHQSVDTLYQ